MTNNNKFEIQNEIIENIYILRLKGFLDAHTAPLLEKAFQEIITHGNYKIVVNFNKLDYISSAGLGVFMLFIEDLRKKNGDIKLTEMNPKIFSVFDLLGFPLLFDIDNNESNSIEKFKNN